ncbi:MAG TPA: PDDEXK nuclease domain-containing protein [Terriglobales bacterium]|nr:PDDEXK nuclease domain-containing protein [Terriglobales bacterium]
MRVRTRLMEPLAPDTYAQFLTDLKQRIQAAQLRASLAVNRELVLLYWEIGRDILDRQARESWGAKVIDRLATDLKRAFPDMKGFSPRNLKYMRRFAEVWAEREFVQQVAAQLPWFHNCVLLDKLRDCDERVWYARAAIQNGWSRAVLVHQIEGALHRRQGKAITNFDRVLATPQSDLAQEITKDPYNFDFLTLDKEAHERDLERGLLDHLRQFLLELGVGFAFVGSQYQLTVGNEDFFIDLLFYHLKLRAYVVVDLKMRAFEPEFAGKMNFYLSAVNDLLRHPDDQPSIGIILCKTKERFVAEYALRDINKPIGISEYRLAESLPEKLRGSLPTIEQLEQELGTVSDEESERPPQP